MPDDPALTDESAADTEAERFVTESATRVAVLKRLVEGPASASAIAADQTVTTAGAKSAAEALHDRGLVELLATDDLHAYGLLPKGERVLFALERKGMI
jgi:hypothetical protein